MPGPITTADLKVYLGLDPATSTDEAAMTAACEAANDMAVRWRPDVTTDPDTLEVLDVWPPTISQGAVVEAARLYGGRGSVQGVAAYADVGVSFIARLDPRVRELWQLGEYQPSVVA